MLCLVLPIGKLPLSSLRCVHFEEAKKHFRNCRVTGVPVRAEFFENPQTRLASPPALLVFGGSQGARASIRP